MQVRESDAKWRDPKVSHLYFTAITARYDPVRREVMKALGVLERTGSDEAARALDEIKRRLAKER